MPQFDFSQAMPQILWLVLVFGLLYLIVRGLLPKVQVVVENRKSRIAADLGEAEAARQAAVDASSGGSSAVAESRSRSLAVTGKARDEANAANAKKIAAVDTALKAQAEAAAASLATQRRAAVAELDQLAGEATVELVKRVSGLDVSNDEAAAAVKKVAA